MRVSSGVGPRSGSTALDSRQIQGFLQNSHLDSLSSLIIMMSQIFRLTIIMSLEQEMPYIPANL